MSDLQLPTMQFVDAHLCVLTKGRYVTFAVAERTSQKVLAAFTLHRVEGRKLCKLLTGILDSPQDTSSFVEGAYLGGPPSDEQLVDGDGDA